MVTLGLLDSIKDYETPRSPLFPVIDPIPRCSSAELFIWEALDNVGRVLHGSDWTGVELRALDWPVSPDDGVKAAKLGRSKKAEDLLTYHRIRPVIQARGFNRPEDGEVGATTPVQQNDHVFRRAVYLRTMAADAAAAREQVAWEANQKARERLFVVVDWLERRFRDGIIKTYSRLVRTAAEPLEMPPSEWFVDNAFKDRFAPGQYRRWYYHPQVQQYDVYIFVHRAELEQAIALLPAGTPALGSVDLALLSPYLRFAIAFAQRYGDNVNVWSKESVIEQIIEDWAEANPSDRMTATMAGRMASIVRIHDPDAIAAGSKAVTGKKTGVT